MSVPPAWRWPVSKFLCPLSGGSSPPLGRMGFANLPGFDIEADPAPLTNIQRPGENNEPTVNPISQFRFTTEPPEDQFGTSSPTQQQQGKPPPQLVETPNGDSNQKVFFITNCGSLLGRTIAQIALERGHCVAACAREKHLPNLKVHGPSFEGVLTS